ncbi:macro domain protein [Vibrio phage 1.081.O._10N.286.52.C2]|nr:macro domain protein [Vibrio phage 1.081.O._10N.286.52.C2]
MITAEIYGDLVATLRSVIAEPKWNKPFLMAQGCNCFIAQGSGIAGQLREFPEVYQADIDYGRKGDVTKLGELSVALFADNTPGHLDAAVFNLYTQFSMGTNKQHAEYAAIKMAVEAMCRDAYAAHNPIYVPLIGAGLAGGDWELIRQIIDKASGTTEIIIVHFDKGTIIDW